MLSLAVVKSRGPLPAGGTDCSTLRSTVGRNGASFWTKRGWAWGRASRALARAEAAAGGGLRTGQAPPKTA